MDSLGKVSESLEDISKAENLPTDVGYQEICSTEPLGIETLGDVNICMSSDDRLKNVVNDTPSVIDAPEETFFGSKQESASTGNTNGEVLNENTSIKLNQDVNMSALSTETPGKKRSSEIVSDASTAHGYSMDVCVADTNIGSEGSEANEISLVSSLPQALSKHDNSVKEDSDNVWSVSVDKNISESTPESDKLSHIINDSDGEEVSIIQEFSNLHRGAVVPYSDTEDSGSSSSSSSYEDSSDSESDKDSSESDDLSNNPIAKKKPKAPNKAKGPLNELNIDDLPPIEDLHISVRNDQASEIGKVLHAVDTLVVVESYKDQPPLDIDSILFLDGGARPLGRIFDVMGPVTEPLYCIRFNSKEHIEEQNIKPGMLVYCAPQTEHSNFVFVKHLLMMKGSDASWKKNGEVPLSEMDFSDDEEEARLRREVAEDTQRAVGSTPNPDEPRFKAQRVDRPLKTPQVEQHGCQRGGGGEVFRPRNPWSWSGSRHNFPRNTYQHSSNQQRQSTSSGPVRPPSFNVNFSSAQGNRPRQSSNYNPNFSGAPNSGYMPSGHQCYPSGPQFGRQPNPRMFGQLPQICYNSNSSWPTQTWEQSQQYSANGYSYPTTGHGIPPPSHVPQIPHSGEDQRYQAFQSEIERLVEAYNKGADSPLSVPPPTFGAPGGQIRRPPPQCPPPGSYTAYSPYGPPQPPGPPPTGSFGPPPHSGMNHPPHQNYYPG